MRWNPSSLRLRVPVSLVAASLLTALFIFIAIGVQSAVNLRADVEHSLTAEARALSAIVAEALRHDDVWTAFTAVLGGRAPAAAVDQQGAFRVVLDAAGRVFVSDRPRRFRLGTPLAKTPLAAILARWSAGMDSGQVAHLEHGGRQYVVMPLLSEDGRIGTLVVAGPQDAVFERLQGLFVQGMVVLGGVMLVILPFGWAWGSRLVAPLVQLAQCMRRVGHDAIEDLECPLYQGQDEIGQLGQGFQAMLRELRRRQDLERQMVAQDRLAAIGRIAGGVAHEINNPLTGMLVAIDSFRHQSAVTRNPEKTLALIERGLKQIQETVSALLVECRVQSRDCTPEDVEDIRRLLEANEAAGHAELIWYNGIDRPLSLPATAVRQILLNLGLNALQAVTGAGGGKVEVEVVADASTLVLQVRNEGKPIPREMLQHIFEPFHTGRPDGTGLGLWITYQVVTQLGGQIEVTSDDRQTSFQVRLPCDQDEAGMAMAGVRA